MIVKTNVKAGALNSNHSEAAAKGLTVRTGVKAGGWQNHSEAAAKGLTVRTGAKAGGWMNHSEAKAKGLAPRTRRQKSTAKARRRGSLTIKTGIKSGITPCI